MIAAYRRVYYGSPASSKADPSVVAVAELLTEMGRRFDDDKALRSAIGQYKFLRREYPGSRDRFDALFTIGQIYQDDLKDPAQAKLYSRSSCIAILTTIWRMTPARLSPNRCSRRA